MIEKGIGLSIESTMKEMNRILSGKYEKKKIDKITCYELPDGQIITITGIITFNAIVVEYAENLGEADKCWFEDGDLFYLSDYDSVVQLTEAVMSEIEGNINN